MSGIPPRGLDVLELAMAGHSLPEIADELALSTFTVSNHLGALRKAKGVRSTTELVALAWAERYAALLERVEVGR